MLAAGYRGPLSLEIFNDEFRSAPSRRIARDGLRGLLWAEEGAGVAAPPAPPGPVRHRVRGVRGGRRRPRRNSAAFLGTLGFRLAGRHRSKAVTLHRNGDVNLVLNAEPDSAASERFEQHGPCVCAMAFRVDDPERALARAEAMLCPTWRERTGEGERRIPAVRAPDGTLVYLVEPPDSGRAPDLGGRLPPRTRARPSTPGRFGGVDHVAQALTPDMMDSFSLFYRAVFGLEPDATWELPDPYGLVRSRAFTGGSGSVRLPLNTSESGRTGTGRFVSAFAGAGVHHIAFCTADAAAATEEAAANGAPLLDIPVNYYEDLGARTRPRRRRTRRPPPPPPALRPEPCPAGGTFRHAYTLPFQDRFFLEIAERKGGYDGFGAANAGVRMAAQGRPQRR